jgi:glyoxylase I family protein
MSNFPADGAPTLHHVALYVSSLEATRRFYVDALGFEERERPADFVFPGAYFRLGSAEVHVVVETEPGRTDALRPRWSDEELRTGYTVHFALGIPDLAPVHARLAEHGVSFVGGPRIRADDVEQWYLADPDGHVVELISSLTPEKAAQRRRELDSDGSAVPVAPGF